MKTDTRQRKIAYTIGFVLASILLHVIFFYAFIFLNNFLFFSELFKRLDHEVVDKTKDLKTQIELVDLKEKSKQIVEQDSEESLKEPPEKAEFLSKNNQKVKEQTKARKNGAFQNAAPSQPTPPSQSKPASKYKTAKEMLQNPTQEPERPKDPKEKLGLKGLEPSRDPKKIADRKQPQKPQEQQLAQKPSQSSPQNSPMQSQTDDFLEDIKEGDFTKLMTRRFRHYSFYSRVKGQLRSRWNPLIRQEVYFLYSTKRSLASLDKKRTTLRVTLNKQGYLQKIELLTTSGNDKVDQAAIQAFRLAAPFPNPPEDLLESDGTIKLFWDFVLET